MARGSASTRGDHYATPSFADQCIRSEPPRWHGGGRSRGGRPTGACRRATAARAAGEGAADSSGKMGKEEPSSHTPSEKPAENSVFVNGVLAVPGAPADTETAPSKFSAKNAADDKLIILAYTFKLLTDEQRRAIYDGLKGQRAGAAFNADIGVELPSSVELRPVPNDVAARVAQTDGYLYAVADDRVLLVAPVNRVVVGVFMDDVQSPKPDGTRRTP